MQLNQNLHFFGRYGTLYVYYPWFWWQPISWKSTKNRDSSRSSHVITLCCYVLQTTSLSLYRAQVKELSSSDATTTASQYCSGRRGFLERNRDHANGVAFYFVSHVRQCCYWSEFVLRCASVPVTIWARIQYHSLTESLWMAANFSSFLIFSFMNQCINVESL